MLNIFNLKLNNSIEKKDNKCRNNKNNNYINEKGIDRHYPPANKEWLNSIYAYNKNTTKLLPRADKALLKLIKSYFNLYSRKLEKKIKSRPLRLRFRKLSINRILVSRAELKHTSNKVNITIYVYNRHLKYYMNILKKKRAVFNLEDFRHHQVKLRILVKKGLNITSNVLQEKEILFKTLNKQTLDKSIFNNYEKDYLKIFIRKFLRREIIYFYIKQIIFINKSKFKSNYLLPLTSLIEKIYKKKIEFNLVNLKYLYLNSYIFTDTIVKKLRKKKTSVYRILTSSLSLFKAPPINTLSILYEMYHKKRTSQNLKVHHFLSNFLDYKQQKENINYSKDDLDLILQKKMEMSVTDEFQKWEKKIKKELDLALNINKLKVKKTKNKLKLNLNLSKNKLNLNLNLSKNKLKLKQNKHSAFLNDKYLYVTNTVLDSIKYKFVKGIAIEAAGRLTRRNTAARSLFKRAYKGNIRNMDSSFKRLSTVLLRGYFKSNLQYTKLNSRRRIGSFGIKGWVSSSN